MEFGGGRYKASTPNVGRAFYTQSATVGLPKFSSPGKLAKPTAQQQLNARPFGATGKIDLNIMGTPTRKEEAPLGPPGAEQLKAMNVPILSAGPVAAVVGGLFDIIAKTPAIPGFGQSPIVTQMYKQAWEGKGSMLANGHLPAELEASRRAWVDKANRNVIDAGQAQAEFIREANRYFARKKGESSILFEDFLSPSENLGDDLRKLVGLPGALQRVALRTMSEPVGRMEDVLTEKEEALPPTLINLRNSFKAGEINEDEFRDLIIQSGYGTMNPLYEKLEAEGWAGEGKSGLQNAAVFVAAGIPQIAAELLTDPLFIGEAVLSGGAAAGLKTVSGIQRGVTRGLADDVARAAGRTAVIEDETFVLKQVEGAARQAADEAGSKTVEPQHYMRALIDSPQYGERARQLVDEMASNGIAQRLALHPESLKTAQRVSSFLDSLSVFGLDKAGKIIQLNKAYVASRGFYDEFGDTAVRSLNRRIAKELGDAASTTSQEMDEVAIGNLALQVGGETNRQRMLAMQGFDSSLHTTDLAKRQVEAYGGDMRNLVRDYTQRVSERIVAKERGGYGAELTRWRERATRRIVDIYGADPEAARRIAEQLGEDEMRLLEFRHWASKGASLEGVKATAVPSKKFGSDLIDRLTISGPRAMHKKALKDFKAAIKKKDVDAVRAFVRKYDQLAFNIDSALEDADLLARAAKVAGAIKDEHMASRVDPDVLPPAIQEWVRKYGVPEEDYSVVLRPTDEALSNPVVSPDGDIVFVPTWVNFINERTASKQGNWATGVWNAMTRGITSTEIRRQARIDFTANMAQRFGVTPAKAESILRRIEREALERKVQPRGLGADEMYTIAMRGETGGLGFSSRQLASALNDAFEGSTRRVGVIPKFTGRLKTLAAGLGDNLLGQLAEKVYPMVKFTLSPFFQAMELFEAPFFLTIKGQLPMRDIGAFMTARHTAMDEKTRYIMDAFQRQSAFIADDTDALHNVVSVGNRAASDIAGEGSTLGKMARRVGEIGQGVTRVGERKRIAEGVVFRNRYATEWVRALKQHAPTTWYAAAAHYQRGQKRKLTDGEIAIEWMLDMMTRSNPDHVWSKLSPELMRPSHLGAMSRVEPKLVNWLVGNKAKLRGDAASGFSDVDTGLPTFEKLRAAVNDPDDLMTLEDVKSALRDAGADEFYIQRVEYQLTFPQPNEWYKRMEDLGTPRAEVLNLRELDESRAAAKGLTLQEYLASQWTDGPLSYDQIGNFQGDAMFQLLADAAEVRGLRVVPATVLRDPNNPLAGETMSPELVALSEVGDEYAQGLPTPESFVGKKVKDMTPAEKKAYTAHRIRADREVDDALGHPNPGMQVLHVDAKGIKRHIVGEVSDDEWFELAEGVLGKDTLREYRDWYTDMGRMALAVNGNDVDEAARFIAAFGLTQANTSPMDGMRFLLRTLEAIRRGEDKALFVNKKAMQQVSGLNGKALHAFLATSKLVPEGQGQKLMDFIDSLLGRKTRAVGVHGPDPDMPWGPAAIDIWAKRDLGFLDAKMGSKYHRLVPGAKSSYYDEATGSIILRMKDGTEQVAVEKQYIGGGAPTDYEYDYAVERYNNLARLANARRWMDHDGWTARDIQAVGWSRAKRAMGDDTGDPRSAFMGNVYAVNVESMPAVGSRYANNYPVQGVATPEVARVITDELLNDTHDRIYQLFGMKPLSVTPSEGSWSYIPTEFQKLPDAEAHRVYTTTPNHTVEYLADRTTMERIVAAYGYLLQQEGVPATKLSKSTPSSTANIEWALDTVIAGHPEQSLVDEFMRRLAAEHPGYKKGMGLARTYDGRPVIRSTWTPDIKRNLKTKTAFKKANPVSDDAIVQRIADEVGIQLEAGPKTLVHRNAVESIYAYNKWSEVDDGADHLATIAGRGGRRGARQRHEPDSLLGRLVGEHRSGTSAQWETSFTQHMARETAASRTLAREYGDGTIPYDPGSPSDLGVSSVAHPDGTTTLHQYGPRGARAAVVRATGARRTTLFLKQGKVAPDTVLHELLHHWLLDLDPSAIRRIKGIKAGMEGTKGGFRGKAAQTLTEEEHHWLIAQLIQYVKDGGTTTHPSLTPFLQFYQGHLGKLRKRVEVSPEVGAILDNILPDVKARTPKGTSWDVDESIALQWAQVSHDRALRHAKDVVHFKGERNWMERSLNHPFLGLYPLSYMWGKVLPELTEFLLFRPFGFKAPGLGLAKVNQMYQSFMTQQENDPELRQFMYDNEAVFRMMSMFVPGLPWDLPVNAPLWVRRWVEAMQTNAVREMEGKKPLKIDLPRIIGDTLSYQYGPARSAEAGLEMVTGAADLVGSALGLGENEEGNELEGPALQQESIDAQVQRRLAQQQAMQTPPPAAPGIDVRGTPQVSVGIQEALEELQGTFEEGVYPAP